MKVTDAKYGDRWDLLAYDLFGDAALAPQLMAANPDLVNVAQSHIPEGVEIVIPDNIAPNSQYQITKVKAPWKD